MGQRKKQHKAMLDYWSLSSLGTSVQACSPRGSSRRWSPTIRHSTCRLARIRRSLSLPLWTAPDYATAWPRSTKRYEARGPVPVRAAHGFAVFRRLATLRRYLNQGPFVNSERIELHIACIIFPKFLGISCWQSLGASQRPPPPRLLSCHLVVCL